MISRTPTFPLALTALGLALLGAQAQAQPAQPGPTEARRLRLFTWNVGTVNPMAMRLPERAVPRVIETIGRARPDVVTLQEVASPAQAAQIVSGLAAGGLTLRRTELVIDTRRDDGRLAVTLYQGEAEVLTHRTSNGFGILALRQGGVTVVNIHAPISASDRTVFFRELGEWVQGLPGPVIVQGDYNCGPNQGAGLSMLMGSHEEQDFYSFNRFTRVVPVGTRPETTNMFGLSIDHVRMTAGRVLRQQVHQRRRVFPMDHDPLEAEVEVEVEVPAASPAEVVTTNLPPPSSSPAGTGMVEVVAPGN